MATFTQLKQEVLNKVQGFVNDQEVLSTLTAGIDASVTSFTVANASDFATGVMELDEELVYVQNVDTSTGVCSNVIRGYRGTTAATHSTGAVVRVAPQFPMTVVGQAVNDTIVAMSPRVPAIKSTDLSATTTQTRYPLPADCTGVIDVSIKDSADTNAYVPLTVWKFIPTPGGSLTGTAIEFQSPITSTVRVVYAAAATALTGSDQFTASGLPEYAREAVVWGALWRLYSLTDLGRSSVNTASQQLLNRSDPTGNSTNISKYLLAAYEKAMQDLEGRVQRLHPVRKHYVW